MSRMHLVGPALAVLAFAGPDLDAQAFAYTDFSSLAGLTLNGAAVQAGNVIQVTPALNNQAGSFWYSTPQPIVNGFDTVFTIRITPNGTPADGMTFAIHNDPAGATALGTGGGALGYQGLSTLFNSLVVEFDTYANGDFAETVANIISVHANGAGPTGCHEAQSIGSIAPPGLLANAQARQVRVEYLASPGLLNVYLDNLVTPLLAIPYSFTTGGTFASSGIPVGPPSLPAGTAYVGFTGGTGGLNEINGVESWTWGSASYAPFTLAITQPNGPGSVSVQVANGPPGAYYLTAISFDNLNASSPGQGWWGGLFISFLDLYALAAFNQPPFSGFLDASGGALFSVPAGLTGPYPPIYAVTRTFGSGFSSINGTTNLVSVVLL